MASGNPQLAPYKLEAELMFMPNPIHVIKNIEKDLKGFSAGDKKLAMDLAKVGCDYVMAKKDYWEQQKKFPKNDPCCQVYKVCEFYNQPWFIYVAGGVAVLLSILITATVTALVVCICMKKKYRGGGGGRTTKKSKSTEKSSKRNTNKSMKNNKKTKKSKKSKK